MAWLKLRLYHLDVLVCGATVATYFLEDRNAETGGEGDADALADGDMDGEDGRV
jgi:hypothetical protein